MSRSGLGKACPSIAAELALAGHRTHIAAISSLGSIGTSVEPPLMPSFYEQIQSHNKGAWVIHHSQKTASTVNGAAEFPALDAAGKAAALLSQMAATSQATIDKTRVNALAKAAGLSRIELPELLRVLDQRRLIEISANGDVEVLGLTSRATVQHAAEIFEEQDPTPEERASIVLAEVTSAAPVPQSQLVEFVGDEFKFGMLQCRELLVRSETVGFVDAEGQNADKLYFNGNLFRRDNLVKAKRVLDSLSEAEQAKVSELDGKLARRGCLDVGTVEMILGKPLLEKLRAAGMYDVNHVANPSGEYGFVTRPTAFHKFNDPLVDDAFDLAKALVAALSYGMTQSKASRGRIEMIGALLRRLINGWSVGPATAIGEDYRVLETKGVIQVTKAPSYGYMMRLLKRDIGEMALKVLITGEAASTNVVDRPLPGTMTGYAGPEKTRSEFRRKQKEVPVSRRGTEDVLQALRTQGKFLMALDTPGGKGFDLEEALKAYFWQAGYFVVRGVPFRLDGEDVTDIDLWIYERPAALTRRRLIVDAKNRRSPKVSERIIWASGLRAALGVDGAIVATSDRRPTARALSKALNVVLLGGDAVAKLTHSEQLNKGGQLRSEELDQAVKRVDESRRSSEWRQTLRDARGALISGMGVQSANRNLATSGFFAEQTIAAQPRSEQAQVALRLFYLTSSLAAISLDFALADQAFRSHEERRQAIISSIRFGEAEGVSTLPTVRAAIGLARKYADNGTAVAKQIEYGFEGDAERIPAEIIADYVARISGSDALFNVARELERASSSVELPCFDDLSSEAKSLLGVFLDFDGVSREKVAEAWPRKGKGGPPVESAATSAAKTGPLFAGGEGRVKSGAPTGKDPRDG